MKLQELPPDTRPREKILTRGPGALSDTELLALLLRTGGAGRNVLQLAQDMLLASGGLANLLLTPPAHQQAIKGLGPAKQSELMAVMELAKRAMAQQLSRREVMQSAASVQFYLQLNLAHNHPSGSVHPSPADLHLTQSLKAALAMVDVRVLDHVIVGPGQAFSMAEQGVL